MRFILGHSAGHFSRFPQDWTELWTARDHGHRTDCWDWIGPVATNGYGRSGRKQAHRVSYEDRFGPIADGLELDHLCRNSLCINPDHLEPVSHAINMRRGANAKLTQDQVDEIRQRYTGRHGEQSSIAREYGVTATTVYYIVHRMTWV